MKKKAWFIHWSEAGMFIWDGYAFFPEIWLGVCLLAGGSPLGGPGGPAQCEINGKIKVKNVQFLVFFITLAPLV